MNSPFFSILIPTRNRPDLLRDAIASSLQQDFDDFEVVVSDNFNNERTASVLNEFVENPRFRTFRTDKLLSMPKHWEFVSGKASGRYVLILTDRSVLKQGALKTIYTAIQNAKNPVDICSWGWSLYDDEAQREFADFSVPQNYCHTLSCRLLLENYAKGFSEYPYSLPRGLNSCYSSVFFDRVSKQFSTPFRPITPDFTSAFIFLNAAKDLLFIEKPLFISQGLNISNGGDSYTKDISPYLDSLGIENIFSHTPLELPLVENALFQDFLATQERAGADRIEPDWTHYFTTCYKELLHKKYSKQMPASEINCFFTEWEKTLHKFNDSIIKSTRNNVRNLMWFRLKLLAKQSPIGPLLLRAKRWQQRKIISNEKLEYNKSILSLAGFDDRPE